MLPCFTIAAALIVVLAGCSSERLPKLKNTLDVANDYQLSGRYPYGKNRTLLLEGEIPMVTDGNAVDATYRSEWMSAAVQDSMDKCVGLLKVMEEREHSEMGIADIIKEIEDIALILLKSVQVSEPRYMIKFDKDIQTIVISEGSVQSGVDSYRSYLDRLRKFTSELRGKNISREDLPMVYIDLEVTHRECLPKSGQ